MKKLLMPLLLSATILGSLPAVAVEQPKDMPTQSVETTQPASNKLNINTAGAEEIQKALIGIGAKKAEAIIQYREKHGNFTSLEQLLEVQGIGKATLEKNRDRFTL